MLKPQHDAEVDEAALLVPNHTMTLSLECRARLTRMVELGAGGFRFQPLPQTWSIPWCLALWLAPESMFSNGQFCLRCLAAPPCTPVPLAILNGKGKEPQLYREFPVSQMRKLKVGGAVPRSLALG